MPPAQIFPVVEIAVAAAEPHQGDEVDLLVHIQVANEAGKLRAIGSTAAISEPWTASSSAEPEFAFNSVAALSDWRDFAAMKNTFSGEIDRFGAFRIGKPSDAI